MNRKKKRKIEEECEQEKEKENKKRIGRKRQVTIRGVYVNKSQWILSFARHRSLLFAQKAGKLIEGDLVERRLRKERKGERWRLRHSWSSERKKWRKMASQAFMELWFQPVLLPVHRCSFYEET